MTYISNIARSDGDPKVLRSGPSSLGVADRLARTLGWLSIGLGLTELMAPGSITRMLGMEGREGLVRTYGAREIFSGIVSLSPDKQLGMWSRVAGDGLDVATGAMRSDNPKRDNVGLALTMVLGIMVVDIVGARAVKARHRREGSRVRSYADRTGFPNGVRAARGTASDFNVSSGTRMPSGSAHGMAQPPEG
jgi:hypothetical protein